MKSVISSHRETDAFQNVLLLIVLSVIAVGLLVLYYQTYRSAEPAELAVRGLIVGSFGLAGWLPWATYRVQTASCKNVLRFLSILVTAGVVLTVITVGITQTVSLGSGVALCCFLLAVSIESLTGRSDWLLVPIWQLVLGTAGFCFYIVLQTTREETLSLAMVAVILVSLSLFIFHRSFIRERENALDGQNTVED